jgi:hypothetical protein
MTRPINRISTGFSVPHFSMFYICFHELCCLDIAMIVPFQAERIKNKNERLSEKNDLF